MNHVRGILVLLLVVTSPVLLRAQNPSENGLFEADFIRGCPGTTVNFTNLYTATCDCLSGCACDYDYNGDGIYNNDKPDPDPNPFEYTFDEPGVYRVEILFSGTSDFITITIEDKPAPDFSVFLCNGQSVQLEVNDTNYESYEIDYGDGTVQTINQGDPIPTHTYANNLNRTVSVRGIDAGSANNCPVSTQDIVPQPSLPAPQISSVSALDPSAILLGLNNQDGIFYEVRMSTNNGPFNTISTITGQLDSQPVDGLDLENNFYCFELVAIDPCGGPEVSSETVCSVQLEVTENNSSAGLTWETGTYDSDVDIYINDQLWTTEPNGTSQYTVDNLVCGTNYCFQVRVSFGGTLSASLPVCIDGDSQTGPPPINDISTIITADGNVDLRWYINEPLVQPAVYKGFEVYRHPEGSLPEVIADVTQIKYIDQTAVIPGLTNYCYEIVPRDYCDNRTPSNVVACLIDLNGSITPADEVTLSWNPYEGYISGVQEYIVEKSYGGGALSELTRVSDTTFTEVDTNPDSQVLMYRITAVPNAGDRRESISRVITLYKSNNVFFPDAFSPDGDGLNDLFEVHARFITEYEIMIFNRWGELIFHATDIGDSWDGVLNGKNVQEGAYAMKVRIIDESGTEIEREGSIIVVRR